MQMAAAAVRPKQKTEMDIELLLRWAYVDELSKRQCSAAEGIWDHILDYSNHGGIDSGRGAAQRYAHFGLPDADAERIEKAVAALDDVVIDWDQHFELIAGDLAGLISINDLTPRDGNRRTPPKTGWGKAGTKALKAFFGEKGARPLRDRPRDVLMVGGIKARVLVVMHAVKGTRPDWTQEPKPHMVPATRGSGPMIVGERGGRNLYTTGSHCPLEWLPSPLSVVSSRADYFAWRQALDRLSETLCLEKFEALPSKAPIAPWLDDNEETSRRILVLPTAQNDVRKWGTLPLKPIRPRAGPPRRR